jgi:hypothetical protein
VKNVQIDTGNIVGANWSLSQTISTGLLGLGNREASLALTDLVIVTFFPFIGETSLSTMPLQEIMWNLRCFNNISYMFCIFWEFVFGVVPRSFF